MMLRCPMAMNREQFQKGLSLPDFIQRSGTEEQCATALESAHRPDGFHCVSAVVPGIPF